MAKRWHQFIPGTAYDRDQVVAICDTHIQSGRLQNPADAKRSLEEIRRCLHTRIVWTPYSGWGQSPMNPKAWRTEANEPISESHIIKAAKGQPANVQSSAHSPPAAHLRPLESTPSGRTIMYGDMSVPVLERNWQGRVERYRYVIHLKQGETWQDARLSSNPQKPATECYVQTPEGSIPPGALAARELAAKGASLAV
jgi:hypothetical protein